MSKSKEKEKVHNYDNDKVHDYEKTILDQNKKKIELQEQLSLLKETMAGLLFEFAQKKDTDTEKQILAKVEEEKQAQAEYDKVLKEQRVTVVSWRKRLAAHFERGHEITDSIILPSVGVGASSIVDANWDGKIIPFENITIYKEKLLGEGAFGTVYRGMVHGNIVAIKRLKQPVSKEGVKDEVSRSNTMNSFETEIGILGGLKHPNILGFMGASFLSAEDVKNENKDGPKLLNCCILTEFAEKGSLHDILYTRSHGDNLRVKFSLTRKFTAIGQIVEGMTHLHSQNVLHLDIKPSNILLDTEYNVKIADFGMSQISSSFQTSLKNFIGGTPYYMAPEILFADDPNVLPNVRASTKSDVYSFGILLNEFLTEVPPYFEMLGSKPTIDDLKNKVKAADLSRPHPIYNEKPDDINKLIVSCWDFDPDKRNSFEQMKQFKIWETAKLSLMIDSTEMIKNELTKRIDSKATKDLKIKVEDFVTIFREVYGLEKELGKKCIQNQAAIDLFLDIPNRDTYPEVELVKVSRFLSWFKGYKSHEIFPAIYKIVKTKWFFGVMGEAEAVARLSKDKLPTGAFLVRWDKEEFVLSYLYKDKQNKKKNTVAHVSTNYKNIRDLFEDVKVWKEKYKLKTDLKSSISPERPGGYKNLEGIWFDASYISSGTAYVFNSTTVNPSLPTPHEQLNQSKGLPSYEIIL